ncbi:hypothetical protein ACYULU_06310 [Breznakiellaceae bacterium SP9]
MTIRANISLNYNSIGYGFDAYYNRNGKKAGTYISPNANPPSVELFTTIKGEFQLPAVMDYMMDWTVRPGTCFLVTSLSLVSRTAPSLPATAATIESPAV